MSSDARTNGMNVSNSWHFDDQFRLWRFVCFLGLGVESTDAHLWLTDIVNQNNLLEPM